ncbi:MAG: hypothetical protein GHCLOJNM_00947 [bacterium]|nr:hypothetical protein [bacterium]
MGLLDSLLGKKKKTIKDFDIRQLDEEKIRLEEEEKRLIKKLNKAEGDKAALFKEGSGKEAKREKIIFARKIQEVDDQAKEINSRLSMISKQLRIVHRLRTVRQNEQRLKETGIWSSIMSMDPVELDAYITDQKTKQAHERERANSILSIFTDDDTYGEELAEDRETMELVRLMEQAGESGHIEEKFSEAEDILNKPSRETE